MKTYVLDSSACMKFLEDRAGADKVEELLAKAAEAAEESVLLSPRQDFEIILVQHNPRSQETADHEEIPA
jgi:uncharacterized protein with PIN domain